LNSARILLAVAALTLLAAICGPLGSARAGEWTRYDRQAARRSATSSWHGSHQNTQYGRPVAVVVPPTAHMQSSYSWGVAQTRMNPNYQQFGRSYPGQAAPAGMPFQPTPRWPSHTDQHGYYYVRGPW
jgi:hypothetical protein